MKYKTVPGIVLASVCGSYFLISPKNNLRINDTVAFYWKQLEKGTDEKSLIDSAVQFYEIDDFDALQKDIEKMLHSFLDMNIIKRYDA